MITFDEGVAVMRHVFEKQGAGAAGDPQVFAQAVAGVIAVVGALEELGWTVEKRGGTEKVGEP